VTAKPGDYCRVKGERGYFRMVRVCTSSTGAVSVHVRLLEKGREGTLIPVTNRFFRPERIRRLRKPPR